MYPIDNMQCFDFNKCFPFSNQTCEVLHASHRHAFSQILFGEKNKSVFANIYLLGLTLLLTYVQPIYFNRSQELGVRTFNLMTQGVQKLAKANEDFLTILWRVCLNRIYLKLLFSVLVQLNKKSGINEMFTTIVLSWDY